jgi:apolipoprotein N-acyltransferase
MKLLLLSFLLGLLSACGFEPLRLWPLTILAFAGTALAARHRAQPLSALARGYWFGFGQFVLGLNWIATAFTYQAAMPAWLGWIAVVALSFYLAVYPAAGAGLAWKYSASRHSQAEAGSVRQSARGDGLRLVLLFAAAWILTEWMRATMFTGFAWNPVGVALLPTPLSHAAALVGTYGLSAVLILVSGALLLLIRRDWRGGAGVALGAGATALLAALATPATLPPTNTPLRIVQPNIGQEYKWSEGFADDSLRLLAACRSGRGSPPSCSGRKRR